MAVAEDVVKLHYPEAYLALAYNRDSFYGDVACQIRSDRSASYKVLGAAVSEEGAWADAVRFLMASETKSEIEQKPLDNDWILKARNSHSTQKSVAHAAYVPKVSPEELE